MGRTACTEPQCLYKGELYLTFTLTKLGLCETIFLNIHNVKFLGNICPVGAATVDAVDGQTMGGNRRFSRLTKTRAKSSTKRGVIPITYLLTYLLHGAESFLRS
jgi:hypothetical protein